MLSRLVCKRLPSEDGKPDRATLWRWLKQASQQGVVSCSGSGHRGDAYLYWLPGREPLLWPGDSASEEEKEEWRERCKAHERSLRERAA